MGKYYEVRGQWNHPELGWIGPDSAALVTKLSDAEIKHAIQNGYLIERDATPVAEIVESAPATVRAKKGGS